MPLADPIAGTRALTARMMAAALTEQAGLPSSAPGLAMPLAVLWSRVLKFDAADPTWFDADRFAAGSAAPLHLLRSILLLTGSSHAARAIHPALEASVLAGGEALGVAVGLAEAERLLAARFGRSLVDHRVWAALDAADLAQGLAQEAVEVAGQHRLDRLAFVIDASAEDVEEARPRLASSGWAVKTVAADDAAGLEAAFSFARRSRKPTAIWCLAGLAAADQVRANGNAVAAWRRCGTRASGTRRVWLRRLALHAQRGEFERIQSARLPDMFPDACGTGKRNGASADAAADSAAGVVSALLDRLWSAVPELVGLRHCAAPSPGTGRWICAPRRPQAIAAIANGVALHGGMAPVCAHGAESLERQLPMLRTVAHLKRRTVHVVEDAPPPADADGAPPAAAPSILAWLRAVPDLLVFRPACGQEAAACLDIAFRSADRPSVLILTAAACGGEPEAEPSRFGTCAHGGYVRAGATQRDATLIASGAGVRTALLVRARLAELGLAIAVVSLPCWALFARRDAAYRQSVLGEAPRFGLESSVRTGWDRWLNAEGAYFGPHEPGFDDPAAGTNPETADPALIATLIRRRLQLAVT
jgi:transketolase